MVNESKTKGNEAYEMLSSQNSVLQNRIELSNYIDNLDTSIYSENSNAKLLDNYISLVEDFMKEVKTNKFQEHQDMMNKLELLTLLGCAIFKNIKNYSFMDNNNAAENIKPSYDVKGTDYAKSNSINSAYNPKLAGNSSYNGNFAKSGQNYSGKTSKAGYSGK